MEQVLNTRTVRRRDASTINLDFHRTGALSERAAMPASIGKQISRAARPVFAICLVILTLWAMPGTEPTNQAVAAWVPMIVGR
jgi:hypothetical protein